MEHIESPSEISVFAWILIKDFGLLRGTKNSCLRFNSKNNDNQLVGGLFDWMGNAGEEIIRL